MPCCVHIQDYFSFKGQVLVIRPDGRFVAIEKKLYDKLSKEGKVDGANWVSEEEPPVGTTEFVPGSSSKFRPQELIFQEEKGEKQ